MTIADRTRSDSSAPATDHSRAVARARRSDESGAGVIDRPTMVPSDPADAGVVDVTAPLLPGGEIVHAGAGRGREATNPLRIPARGWKDIALRVKDEWGDDHIGISAAGVAFYSFLSLFPALVATVSVIGLIVQGDNPTRVIEDMFGALPASARDVLTEQLSSITASSSGSLSVGLVVGVLAALWSASGAIGQMMNTINIAYDEIETRSWARRKLSAIGLTFGAVLFISLVSFCVVALPGLIGRTGLDIGTRRLLNLLIWPFLAVAFGVALAVLYRIAPDRSAARWRWVSVGSLFAIVAWVAVTLGFRFYVANFASYNETYGSLGAVAVLLMWLWLTAVIILLGAEINAEMEHQTARDTTVGGDQPLGGRGAVKADTLGEFRT